MNNELCKYHTFGKPCKFPELLTFVFLFLNLQSSAQSAHKHLRQGDGAYKAKEYNIAEGHYRDAQAAERSYKGSYNLGNTVYMQKRYDDALEMYGNVGERAPSADLRAKAYYNQGNSYMYKQDFEKAVDAYKNSLRNNPRDIEAKKNLAFAQKMLEKQQQQNKEQNKNNQQQQNQQNQQQQNNQDNKDKNNPQNQQQQQPQNPQNNEQKQQQNQPQNQQQNKVNKENLERQLQIMDEEDRKVQQRLKKGKDKGKPVPSSKDW